MPIFNGKAWFRSKIAPYLTKIKSELPPELDNATVAAGISNVYGVMTPAQLGTISGATLHSSTELVVSVGAASTGADYQKIADAYNYFRNESISPSVQPVIEIRGAISAINSAFPFYSVRDLIVRGSSQLDIGTGHELVSSPALLTYMNSVNADSLDLSRHGAIDHVSSSLTFEHLFIHAVSGAYGSPDCFDGLLDSEISFHHCVLSNITFDKCDGTTITLFASVVYNSDLLSDYCYGAEIRAYPIDGSGNSMLGSFNFSIVNGTSPVIVGLPAIVNTRETGGVAGTIKGKTLYMYANTANDRFFYNKRVTLQNLLVYVGEVSSSAVGCLKMERTYINVDYFYINMHGVVTDNKAGVLFTLCDVTTGRFSTRDTRQSSHCTVKFASSTGNLGISTYSTPFHINLLSSSDVRVSSTGSPTITYSQALNVRNTTNNSIIIKT